MNFNNTFSCVTSPHPHQEIYCNGSSTTNLRPPFLMLSVYSQAYSLLPDCRVSRLIQYVSFRDWLLSLSILWNLKENVLKSSHHNDHFN